MSQLKEFKIGLRPYEEFYFDDKSQGNLTRREFRDSFANSQSPNFGKDALKNSMKNSVINMNNYVSQNNL